MKRGAKIAAAAVAVVGLVALASCMTTSIYWDGGFPSGEFRVNVRDLEGKPVKGAVLRVYRGSTRELASGYPLDNHITGQELVSDENGRITAPWKDGSMQFGGHAWQLFWVIPIGAKVPKYDCEITADGFKPLSSRSGGFSSPRTSAMRTSPSPSWRWMASRSSSRSTSTPSRWSGSADPFAADDGGRSVRFWDFTPHGCGPRC